MTELEWNAAGQRRYEVGVDRGVLFPPTGPGVAWNGLIAVKQQPSGGESTPYYMDGVKYLNRPAVEEFEAVLDAYTYPDEFEEFDGYGGENGLLFGQQTRKEFNLCYRTLLGNDTQGQDYGYKIHFVYNCLVTPTARDYKTLSTNVDPLTMSWKLTTTPIAVPGRRPSAHLTINSTKIDPRMLGIVESYIYGTSHTSPRLLTPVQWVHILGLNPFEIVDDAFSGIWPIVPSGSLDLMGDGSGIFEIPPTSKLVELTPGIYGLES